jgi:hypothetical protein
MAMIACCWKARSKPISAITLDDNRHLQGIHASIPVPVPPSSLPIIEPKPPSLHQTKVKVRLVTFVKDDPNILPYWLDYHSAIFGPEKIAVIDHNSQHNTTLRVLRDWQEKGVHLLHTNQSYTNKGEITYQTFKRFFPGGDIYVPLDIDEFVIYYNDSQVPMANRTLIKDSFLEIWQNRTQNDRCWGMKYSFNSFPISLNESMDTIKYFAPYKRQPYNAKKMIINEPAFAGLDHGNHCPKYRGVNCAYCSPLQHIGMLHYHFRIETARRGIVDLIGLGDLPHNATLENISSYKGKLSKMLLRDLPGKHKAKELLRFVTEGLPGLLKSMYDVYPKQGEIMELMTIQEMIETIHAT